jgi:hypothetical protein
LIADLVSALNVASDNQILYKVYSSIEAKLTVNRFNEICVILRYDPDKVPSPVSTTPLEMNRESLLHDNNALQESLSQMARSSGRYIKDLCETEPKAVFLLLLLRFVVRTVKLDTQLLSYASLAQIWWATSGELEAFKLGDVGLDYAILDLLIDGKEVERNLDLLNSLALISSESLNVPRIIWLKEYLTSQIDLLINSLVEIY